MSTEEKTNVGNTDSSSRKPRRRRRSRRPRNNKANWTPKLFKVPAVEGKTRFHDFNLPDVLMHAIYDAGFKYCTPIQAETIAPALEGKDIIGQAQTGTGKTAAFLVGIITDLLDFPLADERKLAEPRALIIAPTRELVMQIAADAEQLCKYAGLNVVSMVGGMDYDKQRKDLAAGPVDILVATPGRLIDFVRNREVDLYNVEVLVLDEADRMLSMGFIPDVRTIIRRTPRKGPERQTLLYSATFTDEVMELAGRWTVDPVRIEIEPTHKTTDNVVQQVFLVSNSEKYTLLTNYLRQNNVERAIVFCNRRHETRDLSEKLKQDGFKSALMSGEIPQNKRVKTLEGFRSGQIEILVATDVAGRGIHVDGVTHVINYQLPDDADDYVHRIGRTGRAGANGTSICFASEDDSFMLPQIQEETGVKMECIHPSVELLTPQSKAEPTAEVAPADSKTENTDVAAVEPEKTAPVEEVAIEEKAAPVEGDSAEKDAQPQAEVLTTTPVEHESEKTAVVEAGSEVTDNTDEADDVEKKTEEEKPAVDAAESEESNEKTAN